MLSPCTTKYNASKLCQKAGVELAAVKDRCAFSRHLSAWCSCVALDGPSKTKSCWVVSEVLQDASLEPTWRVRFCRPFFLVLVRCRQLSLTIFSLKILVKQNFEKKNPVRCVCYAGYNSQKSIRTKGVLIVSHTLSDCLRVLFSQRLPPGKASSLLLRMPKLGKLLRACGSGLSL